MGGLIAEWRTLGVAALLAAYFPVVLYSASYYLTKVHSRMFEDAAKGKREDVDAGAHVSSLIRVMIQGFWALLAMWAVPRFAAAEPASLVPAVILAAALALQPMLWTDALSWGDVRGVVRLAVLAEVVGCAVLVFFFHAIGVYLFALATVVLMPVMYLSARLGFRAAWRKEPFA